MGRGIFYCFFSMMSLPYEAFCEDFLSLCPFVLADGCCLQRDASSFESESAVWHLWGLPRALRICSDVLRQVSSLPGTSSAFQMPWKMVIMKLYRLQSQLLTDISQVVPEAVSKCFFLGFSFVYFCLFEVFISSLYLRSLLPFWEPLTLKGWFNNEKGHNFLTLKLLKTCVSSVGHWGILVTQ